MCITNLCRLQEISLYNNIYQFSGKLYEEYCNNTFDTSGNVTSYINDCLGSSYQTTEQKYTYDALYQLIKVEGECKYSSLKDNYVERDDTYSQVFQYDNIGNLIRKTSADSGVSGKAYTDYLSYNLEYEYNPDYAHRLNKIGRYYYQYDSNGNITAYSPTSFDPEYDIKIVQVNDKEWYLNYNILEGPKLKKRTPSWQRTIFYDDRNQMCEVSDFNSGKQTAYYHYDEDGKRTSKLIWNLQEVLSFGELFSLWLKPSNKWELGQTQKSIMLGQTRLVSKIDSATKGSIRRWKDEHTFYYLSDHIGTANFITTYEGEIYQITEYTPYGERWIERTQNKYNEFYLPYRFAGKPLDEETGWYYFGARYYDPKYQIWTTSDPALTDYFSDTQKGEGGVFNHINLNTYHYAGNNPIKYVDPDGRFFNVIAAGIGAGVGALIGAGAAALSGGNWRDVLAGAAGGAASGALAGITCGGSLVAQAAVAVGVGAAAGAVGNVVTNAVAGKEITAESVGKSALVGAGAGLAGFAVGKAVGAIANKVSTPYGTAHQEISVNALSAKHQVSKGATLYRYGSLGKSATSEGQFWSLENPLTSNGYMGKYGIPAQNASGVHFIETGTIKDGASFITRSAPGIGNNFGGAMEVVVPENAVKLNTFSIVE